MDLSFFLPTQVIMGKGCIVKNAALIAGYGKKAAVVTYPISRENGSLSDVEAALKQQNVDYILIEDAPLNPELSEVHRIGAQARAFGAEMVIGIGGGSALDTAKAVSVLGANDIPAQDLFKNDFANKPLPVITVPTTAGTGAEVTANAVMAIKEKNTKLSFGVQPLTSPKLALLDASYTLTMPYRITADTAVDALSHGMEGYIRSGNTYITDMLGMSIFGIFRECLPALQKGEFTFEQREKLLYNAMLSGIMINHARTLAVHAMGYALTMNRGLSHGAACGILLGDFVEFCYSEAKEKIDSALNALGLDTPEQLTGIIKGLLNQKESYTDEELERYTDECCKAAIAKPNPRKMEREDVLAVFRAALAGQARC